MRPCLLRSDINGLTCCTFLKPARISFPGGLKIFPQPPPFLARHLAGLRLLTWTIRTPDQAETARQHADQIIFEF
jgi:hypothetical protein